MKVLLMNQFFRPDAAPTGELLADLAGRLAADGCSVTVVSGRSRYAGGGKNDMPAVRVHRVPTFPFQRRRFSRLLSYSSFLLMALWHGLRHERPDVVLTMTTPPMLFVAGALIKRFRGVRHFIWEMDVYPDVAVDLGVLRPNGLGTRVLVALAAASRRYADGIIVLGPCMRKRLLRCGLAPEKLHVVDNWVDGESIRPPSREARDGALRVLYSGNLGLAHDVETICRVMEELKDDPRFRFTFAGGGARRPEVEEFCRIRNLHRVDFQPYCPRDRLGEALGSADLGLVTQLPASVGSLVPGKIYGLLAAGRPLLFIGPRDSTAARIVSRHDCGWQADCGDWAAVKSLLLSLAVRPDLLELAGNRARRAFLMEYDRPLGTAKIAAILGAALPAMQGGG